MGRWADKYPNSDNSRYMDMEEEAAINDFAKEMEALVYQRGLDDRRCILFDNFGKAINNVAKAINNTKNVEGADKKKHDLDDKKLAAFENSVKVLAESIAESGRQQQQTIAESIAASSRQQQQLIIESNRQQQQLIIESSRQQQQLIAELIKQQQQAKPPIIININASNEDDINRLKELLK